MCNFLKTMFTKKQPKKWTFNNKLIVNWNAKLKCKYDMITVCKIILSEILNIDDIELTVTVNDTQIKLYDTPDFNLEAMLLGYPNLKKYTLLLRSDIGAANILPIVCHEMWHLSQMNRGYLEIINKNFKWKGQLYPGLTPYFDRPWEKEALKEQREIEKKVKKLYFE